jgi:long-subunit fatty acid transport protein
MDVDLDGMATAYPDESASIADLASWVQKNTAIIEMFMRNGLELAELRLDNLGRRENGQIVVLDYSTLA